MREGKIRTLFVEDEPDVREIVEMTLALDPAFELTTFGSGREALAALDRRAEYFDVALLNMRLPEMTGLELHAELRKRSGLEDLRTVMITASVMPSDKKAYRQAGVAAVIEKPFDPMRLAAQLHEIMR